MQIQQMPIEALIPYARNSRTHDDAQVAQIAASIREFSFTNPVLIDQDGGIIAGHGRVLAARKLNMQEVPCLVLAHLTDVQKRAYVIADNRLALKSDWNEELLRSELEGLADEGFDINLTGFDELPADVDALDEMPELPDGDKEPFQQKTFTLHDEQAAIVDDAVTLARTNPLVDTGLNENSNGNALALICAEWLKAHGKR
jgi:ParB-like chromosome segregation protein Spo0J